MLDIKSFSSIICEQIFNIKVLNESCNLYLRIESSRNIPYYSFYVTLLTLKSDDFCCEWLAMKIVCFELDVTHTRSQGTYYLKLTKVRYISQLSYAILVLEICPQIMLLQPISWGMFFDKKSHFYTLKFKGTFK